MKIKNRTLPLATTLLMATSVGSALAQTTFTGPNSGNNDGWNNAANWDAGIPTGAIDVIIPDNRQVMVQDNNTALVTQIYSGTLTLGAGATLNIGYTNGSIEDYRALGTPGTTVITAGAGATFGFNRVPGTVIVPEIQMLGDILIKTGSSTNNVPDLFFDHGIHGAHTVTVDGKSNSELNLSDANTFSELIVVPTDGNLIEFNATAADSLSGDVTILSAGNGNPAANLTIDAADAMADTATLSISGTTATLLTVNFDDTIKNLLINGVTQPAGTYGTGQDYDPSWYSGAGVLTVTGAPATYWDIDGTTAGAGGATPAGTWDLNSTANWDTVADGTGAAALWSASAGQAATFAAGSDATGTYAVTVSGTQDIGGLTVEEGDVTLSGDGLQMTSDSLVGIAAGSSLTVSSVISNDSARQLAKNGDGTLTLSGANTYTGQTKLEAGTLSVASLANAGADSPLGNYPTAGTDGLELFGGMLEYTGATASSDRGFTLKGNSAIDISAASTTLTLGDSQAIDASGSLNVTGGAGSSLALGAFYVSKANSTLNPTTAGLSIASIGLNEPYAFGSLTLTLGGTATGNEVAGAINRVNTHPSNWDGCHDVVKEGSGDWTLSGSSDYNGNTYVRGGNLIAGTNALNNANGAFGRQNNVDLDLGVANGNDDAGILIGGAYTIGRKVRLQTANTADSGTRVLTLGGTTADSSVFSGAIILGDDNNAGRGVTLTAAAGGDVTFSGGIQNPNGMDATSYTVTKAGDGTVYLPTASYTGSTDVTAGTLSVGDGTNTIGLSDYGSVSVATGATLDLNYTGTDFVLNLNLGGSPAAAGEWGAVGSGAANESALLTGTGRLNNGGGLLANIFLWDGGSSDIVGNGDLSSAGGSGNWDAAIKNWDIGNTPYVAWGNTTADKAVFGGAAGTVTLDTDLNIGEMQISDSNGYTIGDAADTTTLNFGGANMITSSGLENILIRTGIAGAPDITFAGRANNGAKHLRLEPNAGVTQTLGTVAMINTFGSNKTIVLGGAGTGNVADAVTWSNTGNQLALTKSGTGDWTITNNVSLQSGRLYVEEGTMTLGGTDNYFSHKVSVATISFTTHTASNLTSKLIVGGDFTINDNRDWFVIQNMGTLAPGGSVGTLNLDWNRNNGDDAKLWFQNGSTYEWELGAANVSDVIDIAETGSQDNYLQIDAGTTLKVVDAGGTPSAGDQLTVFTYDLGVTTPDTATLNANITIDISGTSYSGTPSLVNDGAGTIYITGINSGGGGTPYETWATGGELFEDDENGDGVSNGMAFLLGAADPDADALGLLPTGTENGSGGLVLTFSMLNAANRGAASMSTQHSADLGNTDAWDAAGNEETVPETTSTVGVVDFVITPNGSLNDVVATIPVGEANGGDALFGRLKATE